MPNQWFLQDKTASDQTHEAIFHGVKAREIWWHNQLIWYKSSMIKIVLTWGASPSDLDSHLVGEYGGKKYHVFYSHKNEMVDGTLVASLDRDDTTSYGPETTKFIMAIGSYYYFYVYNFSGNNRSNIKNSGALVQLTGGWIGNWTSDASTATGDENGRYWNVFCLTSDRLIIRNTLTTSPETDYARGD